MNMTSLRWAGLIGIGVLLAGCKTPTADMSAAGIAPSAAVSEPVSGCARIGPQLRFETTSQDLGTVAPGSVNAVDFVFTNAGSEELAIERLHATCGCAVPHLSKRYYAPGESGIIRVQYTAPITPIKDVSAVFVVSNDRQHTPIELTVTAVIAVFVEIRPEEVSLLLGRENAEMPELVVAATDEQAFSITGITATGEAVSIAFDPAQKATRFVLQPKIDTDRLSQTPRGVIEVHTDHPRSGPLTVRFSARPQIELSPSRIILQNAVPGQAVSREVRVIHHAGRLTEIESFVSANGLMTIASHRSDGEDLIITVTITPPTEQAADAVNPRYITDTLTLYLADGQEAALRCSGWFQTP